MFGEFFHHSLLRKYVVLFGTLFNSLHIKRNRTGTDGEQDIKVPISFAPRQKILVRAQQDPTGARVTEIRLPIMSFEITGYQYNVNRKRHRRNVSAITPQSVAHSDITGQVPWDINFDLNIYVNTQEDGLKIIEQIIPYFDSDWTVRAQILDDFPDKVIDVPVIFNGFDSVDAYEDDFIKRRMIIYTLHFTMQAMFFGPSRTSKLIKIAFADIYTKDEMLVSDSGITVQPGLTANGLPTTDITETIPYLNIDEDDDWGVIVTIRDEPRQ